MTGRRDKNCPRLNIIPACIKCTENYIGKILETQGFRIFFNELIY